MPLLLLLLGLTSSWPDSIPVLSLAFDAGDWEYACENWDEDIWVEAVLISEGLEYPCEFRIRGETSRVYPKKSIKLVLDGGAALFGQSELNLNAEYLDRTRIRECLSYLYFAGIGQSVPEVHFVELVFNGETQGAYLSVQDVDAAFLEETPLPDDAVIYKCAHRYASLDSVTDLAPYVKKTAEDEAWDDLIQLIHWLALTPDSLFEEGLMARFYLEDLMTCMAVNVLLGHGSTYYHNYHLILDQSGATGPWRFLPWDMDRTWGMYGPELPYSRNSSTEGIRRNPLIWRMWCSDTLRTALIHDIQRLEPGLQIFAASGVIDSLGALTRPLVEVDPFREFTMDEFDADLEVIAGWPAARSAALESMFASWPAPIRILPPERTGSGLLVPWQDAGPGLVYTVKVSADITFEEESAVMFQVSTADTFLIIPAQFCQDGAWMDVFIASDAGSFRSQNGPLAPEEIPGPSLGGGMVINEINYLCGPDLYAGDWLELVNSGQDTVNLAGWAIRDVDDRHLTTLPAVLVAPGCFAVLPCDSLSFAGAHAGVPVEYGTMNYGLSDGGDQVRLYDLMGNLCDYVAYLPGTPWPWEAAGYGPTLSLIDPSLPNSMASSWTVGPAGGTPGLPNDSEIGEYGSIAVRACGPRPNPADQGFVMVLNCVESSQVEFLIYDIGGRLAAPARIESVGEGATSLQFDTSTLDTGLYFIRVRHMGQAISFPLVVLRSSP
jgi:hypothetical protein